MDSPWTWTLFSVFIITSQNNVRVWAQNVVPSRPLPQLPSLRENDCPGSPGGPTPPQMNNLRNFEKGLEPQQMPIEFSRPPVFPEVRPPIQNVLRLPIETVATGSRPCPPPSTPVQQANLPPLQSSPLPPRIPNLFSLPREQILSNPQTSLSPVVNLPVPQREQCTQCSQDLSQPIQSIIPQPNRLPTPLFSSLNPFRFFNSNPQTEPLTSTFPVVSQVPGIPLQEPSIQNNVVPPYTSAFVPNNSIGPIETVSTLPVSTLCNDALYGSSNTLPPSLPPSPLPNFPPPFLPFNPFRSLLFGQNSFSKPLLNTVPSSPTENCPSNCHLDNLNSQNLPLNPISPPCALPAGPLNNAVPSLDMIHSLPFSNLNTFGQQGNLNLQQNTIIPPQQGLINNAPILPKTSCLQPSIVPIPTTPIPVNMFQGPIGIPSLNPLPPPLFSAAYPPLVPPLNSQPPCTLTKDLSSIGFIPTLRNSLNSVPTIPTNEAAQVYQTTALPPVVTCPINNVPYQSSKIEESPIPITLQINMPAPTIPAPKIILITPPPAASAPVFEEDTKAVELFEPYPLPPIIIESRRSRSKSWLPLFLVAMFAGDGCGCGGGCCDSNSEPTIVPYPMPVPTNNPIIFN